MIEKQFLFDPIDYGSTFDAVNKRELELGAGTMASMIMLIDKYIPAP